MSIALATRTSGGDGSSPPSRLFHRFTVKQYHRLIEFGILNANDRVELIEGYIVDKMPQNSPHGAAITRITRRLIPVLPSEWLLRIQSAVTLQASEPEPDFAIVPGPEELYVNRKPGPRDINLLIEVGDSTLLLDRRAKGSLYAKARIPEYWNVNLPEQKVEVYTQPRGGKHPLYRQRTDYGIDEAVPLMLAGEEIARILVRELLPPEGANAKSSA
jgi:hypothetical protein